MITSRCKRFPTYALIVIMAPKKIVIGMVGILPNALPKIVVQRDPCTSNIIADIPFMSTETLQLMNGKSSKEVNLMVKAELLLRSIELGWQVHAGDMICVDDEAQPEDMTVNEKDVHDDFTPFGEDGSIPKGLRKAQPRWVKYSDMHMDIEDLLQCTDDSYVGVTTW